MNKLTITKAYLAWLSISLILWVISLVTGELQVLMGMSVDQVYDPKSGISREGMITSFIIISLIYWLITLAISGLFVKFTNKNKSWAKYLLTLFCIFQIYYEISTHYVVATTYNYTPNLPISIINTALNILSILSLIILGILPHVKSQRSIS